MKIYFHPGFPLWEFEIPMINFWKGFPPFLQLATHITRESKINIFLRDELVSVPEPAAPLI